tara:strand:+ start:3763 stop:4776 length:1014 start_codon:yes stop_codon:yes gene_type:complete
MNLLQKKRKNITLKNTNSKKICITIGDIEGIGIRLLIDLWKKDKINNFFLLTNFSLFKKYIKNNNIKINIKKINDNTIKQKSNYFLIYNIQAKNNEENTYNALIKSYELYKKKYCVGIINLPLNKEKIINKINRNFVGQTEFYQRIEKKETSNMIFYSNKLITCTLTTHIPIKKINLFLYKKNYIFNKIKLLFNTLKKDFNIKKPKIAFMGINPHAGENGKIGKEEIFIKKTIKRLNQSKYYIKGPFSADSFFSKENIKYYDCFVCVYHDQALIPFKILTNFKGLNFTGSLNTLRISPIHGTGINIKNLKKANNKSLLFCFSKITKISKNRNKFDYS